MPMNSLAYDLDGRGSPRPDANAVYDDGTSLVSKILYVICCKARSSHSVEIVRAYDDKARAQADLKVAVSTSDDEFWISQVPLVSPRH